MKVIQINAVYETSSTGRTTMEMHEAMLHMGIESYVASPNLAALKENSYQIGHRADWKRHALLSRITGKQGYFSAGATRQLLKYLDQLNPDIIHLRNLHANYINLNMLLSEISKRDICTVITLHDCWFYTGRCVYYIECGCNRWLQECGNCPALHSGNNSLIFDRSSQMLADKKRLFSAIRKLAVIGVSQWVTNDASRSILKDASIIKCIYNWIDMDIFRPRDCAALREEMNLKGKFVILGVSAGWSKQKGIEVFTDLADMLPEDCQIVLAGDASSVINKRDKIKFIGSVADIGRLSELYSMADVFVNPTIQETFGKTTAEAMASGTPVVAYNGTATPELVGTDGTGGYLIDQNRANLYFEQIMVIRQNSKLFYTEQVRARAEQMFSKDKNIQSYIEVYKALMETP